NSAYNLAFALRLSGELRIMSLERTLSEIVRRHEALRTRFPAVDGEPAQVIDELGAVELPVIDLGGLSPETGREEARRLALREARRPFDLAAGPLLRASVVRLGPEERLALLTMHHIVSDGWSMGVLIREVGTLYGAYSQGRPSPLEELPVQYADYAVWQRNYLEGGVLERQLEYWRERLGDRPPALELPTDRPRPAAQSHQGGSESFTIGEEVRRGLERLCRGRGTTLFMTLLGAFKTLLHRYRGQTEIVVGSPIAGRTRAETEQLIGFFVNTLALRTDLSGNPSFEELLERVKETALGAYAHQETPFERLVEELRPERSLSYAAVY